MFIKFHTQTGPGPCFVCWVQVFVKGLHLICCKIITTPLHFHTLHIVHSRGCSGDYYYPVLCKLCKVHMPIVDTSNSTSMWLFIWWVGEIITLAFLDKKAGKKFAIRVLYLEIHSKFPQTLNWHWLFAIFPTHLQVPHKSGCSNLIRGPQSQKSVHLRHVYLMYQMHCSMQIREMFTLKYSL